MCSEICIRDSLYTEQLNVTNNDLALRASTEMSNFALLLGQEQDEVGGGFQKGEAFIGYLSELNIWNSILNAKDVTDMASCQTMPRGNIVSWEKSTLIGYNVIMEDITDSSYFCNTSTKYVIFTEKMRFSEGMTLCKIHGGSLAVPESDQDSHKILNIVSTHKNICTQDSDSKQEDAVWIGAKKINDKWYYLSDTQSHGTQLNYTKISKMRSTSYSDCAYLKYDGFWQQANSNCKELSLCTVCEMKEDPVFTIKGLCYESDYDWNYYLIVDSDSTVSYTHLRAHET